MSVESTNPPSGASNNIVSYLMSKSIKRENKAVATTDMAEQDPSKDLTGVENGDNTIIEVAQLVDINPELDRVILSGASSEEILAVLTSAYISRGMEAVGERAEYLNGEKNPTIIAAIEALKKQIFARSGVMNYHDYKMAQLRAREEAEKTEKEPEEHDKDNNGIDDRLEQ